MKLPEKYNFIKDDLNQVDQILFETLSHAEEPIKSLSTELLASGGKRTRPLFCLLSSRFGRNIARKPYAVAASIELIHMSSLVHDDMIDNAPLRRGMTTIHKQYNHQYATFIGDYLFAQGLELIAQVNSSRSHQAFAATLKKLSFGELEQLNNRYQMNPSFKAYLRKNRNKTARLIAVSCQLGAIATDATPAIEQTLSWFGYYLGMSYQIIDDILDFTDQNKQIGKLVGQDLTEGYLTLPTLLALQDKKIYDKIEQKFLQRSIDSTVDFNELINEIKQPHILEKSYHYSQWYLNKARKEIERLPNQVEKQLLYQVVGYLSKRKY